MTDKIDAALAALTGPVPERYSQAVAEGWKARTEEHAAAEAITKQLRRESMELRNYIRRKLLSKKRPMVTVEFNSPRMHYIDHRRENGKPEVIGPYIHFTVSTGRAWRIQVETMIRNRAHLDEILAKVALMCEAQA